MHHGSALLEAPQTHDDSWHATMPYFVAADQISGSEIRDVVVSIYTERCNMARALKDTDSIVRSLELSLGAAIHFLFCAIYLTIWCVRRNAGMRGSSTSVPFLP